MLKQYFKKLLEKLNWSRLKALEFKNDYEAPEDKAEAKAAEDAAYQELSVYDRKAVDMWKAQLASFKANFAGINTFVNDVILANFDECEFYTCEEGELGECMLIAARFEGEATAPVFYFFQDGIKEKKE